MIAWDWVEGVVRLGKTYQKYSFVHGNSGANFDFSKIDGSTFRVDTANYGGLTIDQVSFCKQGSM